MRINLHYRYFVLLILCVLVLKGCVTPPSPDTLADPVDKRIYIEEQIIASLSSDPLYAAMLVLNEQEEMELFIDQELNEYKKRIVAHVDREIGSAIESNNYEYAHALLSALTYIDSQYAHRYDDQYVRVLQVRAYLVNGDNIPLLHAFNELHSLAELSTAELRDIAEISFQHNYRQSLQRIIDELIMRGSAINAQYRHLSREHNPDFDVMLDGTVTVVVDRGFKIENGVGLPDRAIGSGFFIDSRGYLITNYHVVSSEVDPTYEGFTRLHIRLANDSNTRVPAKVVGYDRSLDIALLKAEVVPEYIFPIVNNRTALTPGKNIFALGSPVGLQNSITSGIVSSTDRYFLPVGESLQIDVPVNPGNSGGPLVDDRGYLVGIVFAGIAELQGINFAIPSRWLWRSIPKLFREDRQIERFWIGAHVKMSADGMEVLYLFPGSPAENIGIQVGDIIERAHGQPVQSVSDIQYITDGYAHPGLMQLQWRRDEERFTRYAFLSDRPFSPIEDALDIQERESLFPPIFGMQVSRTSPSNKNRFVVQRIYSGTAAEELGISISDPLTLLNWEVDTERRIIIMRMVIQKRRAGFSNSGVQIFGRMDVANFI